MLPGIARKPGPIARKERHSGEGYRVIDDIYSPTFYATITRTDYLDATALPMEALRRRGVLSTRKMSAHQFAIDGQCRLWLKRP
jgi:hypothetical protein